ncbi:hypothetical protein D3C84_619400 [compost metagenome]
MFTTQKIVSLLKSAASQSAPRAMTKTAICLKNSENPSPVKALTRLGASRTPSLLDSITLWKYLVATLNRAIQRISERGMNRPARASKALKASGLDCRP